MSDVILVVLRRPDLAADVLAAAGHFADRIGAGRINVLAVRDPVRVPPIVDETLTHEIDAALAGRDQEQRRIEALKDAFDRWLGGRRGRGAAALWHEQEGSAPNLVEERGRRSDIVVVSRPQADDEAVTHKVVRTALFDTERPVLMLPPSPPESIGRRVVIAWKDDQRMQKALIPAMRFLDRAEQVYVLVGVRPGSRAPELPGMLAEHGVSAELQSLPVGPEPFGQSLLEHAHRLGADLLVMGAYVHSPMREFVLGGVTRYMLTQADLPVFLRH